MKKLYKFFLQVRSINEKQKRRELIKKIAERKEKEKEIEEIEREKGRVISNFGGEVEKPSLPAWYLAHFLQYVEVLREKKKEKEDELKRLYKEEEERRKIYMDAKKDYDVARRFVYRKYEEERREVMKKEEKFSDEIAIFGKFRESKSETENE